MPQILSLRRLFSRLLTSDEVDDNFIGVATDFAGASDPAGLPGATVFPYMLWADTGSGWLKRRNAANTGWVSEGRLLRQALQLFSVGEIPTTNVGDIQVDGRGLYRWNGSAYAQVRSSINERTDTATQVAVALGGLAANGAIIEQGANASGSWIKFGDGTQLAYIRQNVSLAGATWTSATAGLSYLSLGAIAYPVAFVGDNPVVLEFTFSDNDISGRSAYWSAAPTGVGLTQFTSAGYLSAPVSPAPVGGAGMFRATLLGKWK